MIDSQSYITLLSVRYPRSTAPGRSSQLSWHRDWGRQSSFCASLMCGCRVRQTCVIVAEGKFAKSITNGFPSWFMLITYQIRKAAHFICSLQLVLLLSEVLTPQLSLARFRSPVKMQLVAFTVIWSITRQRAASSEEYDCSYRSGQSAFKSVSEFHLALSRVPAGRQICQ